MISPILIFLLLTVGCMIVIFGAIWTYDYLEMKYSPGTGGVFIMSLLFSIFFATIMTFGYLLVTTGV